MKASDYFTYPESLPFSEFFDPNAAPWEWIANISEALAGIASMHMPSNVPEDVQIEGEVFVHESVKLPAYCVIKGPAWIGEGVEIRPGVFIRGNVIVGKGSILGNSCEYKNCLLLENTQSPHFNYVGDSVLGNRAHIGAGVILSNLRLDQKSIQVDAGGQKVDTGMRKFGAILGDEAEVGCNAALMPGSIVGKRSLIGPLTSFKGTLAEGQMLISKPDTVARARLD